ncbi:formyltetrahydrofolate deformylase [Niveispirillum fermenti]|uniref:formyltetrahydrofolate deformylase n=1 Tax=Niveispirillum fermenti TaxID=1233113 RepID=UPI003A898237
MSVTGEKGPYVLVVRCPDRKGIVAAVSTYLARHDASITESNHFNDAINDLFFMRTVFRADGPEFPDLAALKEGFAPIAAAHDMRWELHDMGVKPKVVIAVSKFGHCLYDLLHRQRSGILRMDIPAVVSNHDDMRSFVEWSGIPYHHLPVGRDNKAEQEARFTQIIKDSGADLVVLARYMQILSPEFCDVLEGRCINIHHSFLPSFKGAKPYHQAHDRGVKIIGATAHFVTRALDEGPIIEQDIQRVDHSHTPDDLVNMGRDVECAVLARAVKWQLEHRIIMDGKRTVIFR